MKSIRLQRVGWIVSLCLFLIFICCVRGPKFQAVIIKAAGYLPNTQAPEVADAITHATSEGGNTHVFTDTLVKHLTASSIKTDVVEFSELEMKHLEEADVIIFACPTYGGKFPEKLQKLVSKLKDVLYSDAKSICTEFTSCYNPEAGDKAINHFNDLSAM